MAAQIERSAATAVLGRLDAVVRTAAVNVKRSGSLSIDR